VAWQEHQPAHGRRIKGDMGQVKGESSYPSVAQPEEEMGCRE